MSSFKAHEKRKKTLLVEYKNQFKSNKFTDKRIGENDTSLTLDDKMFKRFVAERQKRKERKSSKYNLNDDNDDLDGGPSSNQVEDLTHFGQSLAQIEKFEKVDLSDDDDDENGDDKNRGKIDAKIVSQNFFGGFKERTEEEKKKNRKDWIEEMILKSKQAKYERQKEKDKTLDLTEELDKEWRNIMPLIGSMNKKLRDEENAKSKENEPKPDDFDVLVRKLQFDPKGKPTDKTKTPEELKKEQTEEAKKQEKALLERMNKEVLEIDEDDENAKRAKKGMKKVPANHQSVDDMEFNEPEYLQMLQQDEIKKKNSIRQSANEQINAKKTDEEEKSSDDDENETASDEENENEEDEDEDEEEEGDESEASDSTDSESDQQSETTTTTATTEITKLADSIETKTANKEKWLIQFDSMCSKVKKSAIDLKQFETQLQSLIEKQLDVSKDEANKSRLCELVKHLISFYQSLFKHQQQQTLKIDTDLIKLLTKFIYELTFKNGNKSTKKEPSPYVALFKDLLVALNQAHRRQKLSERKFPHLDTLFTFKLILNVFPTSDYRHQVVTPGLIMMTRYLSECSILNIGDLFRGSFLCHLCYEFTVKSKRFIPECIQYLNGVFYLAVDWKNLIDKNDPPKNQLHTYYISTLYESFKKAKIDLVVSEKVEKLEELSLVKMCENESQDLDNSLKASIIAYNLDLLKVFVKLNESIVSFRELFHLTNILLGHLPSKNYPKAIKERIQEVEILIAEVGEEAKEHLKCLNKKPVPNKLHEPRVEAKSKFDPRHHNAVISEKQLLTRKYKKEMKSAIKEIRQDNQFLARVQLQEKMEKDAKRSQKVKEIMSSLSTQEGEYQKAKRQKN